MISYGNYGGDSSVSAYDYGDDYIEVEFDDGSTYTYTYASAGVGNVEEMKQLADCGEGLNSYINTYCKYDYE